MIFENKFIAFTNSEKNMHVIRLQQIGISMPFLGETSRLESVLMWRKEAENQRSTELLFVGRSVGKKTHKHLEKLGIVFTFREFKKTLLKKFQENFYFYIFTYYLVLFIAVLFYTLCLP